jgi:anti-sigma-K factor RskA
VTHAELRERLEAYAIGALTVEEHRQVELHVGECPACRADLADLAVVQLALAKLTAEATPGSQVRRSIMGRVESGARRSSGGAPEATAGRRALSPARAWTGWLAAAASLTLAAFLGWDARRLRGQVSQLEDQLQIAREAAAAGERQLASLRGASERQLSALTVLTAPDVARIDLAGQPVAPSASARAFWSRARGMVFEASRLPPPPPGRTYQLWVVTANAPVSAGLIEPDPSGNVHAVIATPPDIPDPVAVAVTLEPAGGVPAPTGEKYLVGLAGARG